MFHGGLIEEVKHILSLGFSRECKPFESHGYRQTIDLLDGRLSFDEAVYHAQQNTRRYAKRQWTWFAREIGVQWFRTFGDDSLTRTISLDSVHGFLKNSKG
jgi:tRNA dimethylallyltransferase